MKSVRLRLAVWFVVSLLTVMSLFVVVTRHYLQEELHNRNWRKNYPNHPDWKIHGSYSQEEIDDLLGELVEASLLYGIPIACVALVIGYFLARNSLQPIARVNQQLRAIRASNLSQPITLPEADVEFRELLDELNQLLSRLDRSFNDVREYAAKVAHELRTPLAILRLKVEQAGPRIAPDIAEDLHDELHHLTHVVEQSLLIARAERGQIVSNAQPFDISELVQDVAQDFALLAADEDRAFVVRCEPKAIVLGDARHLRQVIHNLFTNALKHGRGAVRVKVRRHGDKVCFTLTNWKGGKASSGRGILGLGLRVVESLLAVHGNVTYRRRQTNNSYCVRLYLPAAHAAAEAHSDVKVATAPALDPVI